MTDSAVPWARQTFGDLAEPLATAIVKSLTRAHERARSGHDGVHTQTLEAYGHGLYAAQFEELMAGLEGLAGATSVRLHARTVMVVADHLIYPFRYASKDLPVTAARLKKKDGLRAELIREFGPEPMQGELDLGLEEFENHESHRGLAQIPPGTSLVIVAYACSMSEGILRLEWGVADLRPDRYLQWHRHEAM
ncbi:hypothetical protein [Streptomyces albidus (ex Kaewkla and Franco 2022)]|uniref:hypothetical protein n=1 Tax=Streptomyces albidus (ex Kaewkla and Franco 2022) TaxID=722709 RepID=UPI0015EEBB3B|nr:hypothetical protein [Streptomyces albidus (ex Kaewkla and Franco 2022)]